MKKILKISKYIVALPVMAFLLGGGYIDIFLRKSLLKLGIFEQPKPARSKSPQEAAQGQKPYPRPDGRDDAFLGLMSYVESHSDEWISSFRKELEQIETVEAHRCCDPHLYAVLKPTRGENLRRIGNILRDVDPGMYQHSLEEIRGLKHTRDFENGQ